MVAKLVAIILVDASRSPIRDRALYNVLNPSAKMITCYTSKSVGQTVEKRMIMRSLKTSQLTRKSKMFALRSTLYAHGVEQNWNFRMTGSWQFGWIETLPPVRRSSFRDS